MGKNMGESSSEVIENMETFHSKSKISVCMIVKNEEANLRANLPTLVRLFDEVVVVDTGSTDHTTQVAEEHGTRLYERLWDHDFSMARNFAIAHATGDYILILDADETIEDDARVILDKFTQHHPNSLGITHVISKEATPDGALHEVVSHITRFMPNHPSIRYQGIIHEQVVDQSATRGRHSTGLTIRHSGYALSKEDMIKKSLRNLELIDRALVSIPSSPQRAYYLYQRGKSLDQLQQYDEALRNYEDATKSSSPDQPFFPELTMAYLYDLKRIKDQNRLWPAVNTALKIYPDYSDLYFLIGISLIQLQVPALDMIRQSFESCLAVGEQPDKYPTVLGTGSFLAAYNLGAFFESLKDIEQAKRYYEMAAELDYQPARERLQKIDS